MAFLYPAYKALRRDSGEVRHPRHISRKVKSAIGLAAIAGVSGLGYGCSARTTAQVSEKHGSAVVTRVFGLDKVTYGGQDVTIKGEQVKINYPMPLSPDLNWASEEFNGSVTVEVAINKDPKKAKATETIDFRKSPPEIYETVPPEAFTTTVYLTNPMDDKQFKRDQGVEWALYHGASDLISSMPGDVRLPGVDATQNVLGGLLLINVFKIASQECGPAAWPNLEPIIESTMVRDMVSDHNFHNPDKPVTNKQVHITLPTAAQMTPPDQYSSWDAIHKNELAGNQVSVKDVDVHSLQCKSHIDVPQGG